EDASLKSRDVAALDTRQRKQDISRYGEDETAPARTRTEPSAVSVPAVPVPVSEHVVAAAEKAFATADKEPATSSAQDKNVPIARP
ncbi:hypothetical protein SB759_36605, partial [Pseudomonas sp. SIMBA_059]